MLAGIVDLVAIVGVAKSSALPLAASHLAEFNNGPVWWFAAGSTTLSPATCKHGR
jgi:hypothetical protein